MTVPSTRPPIVPRTKPLEPVLGNEVLVPRTEGVVAVVVLVELPLPPVVTLAQPPLLTLMLVLLLLLFELLPLLLLPPLVLLLVLLLPELEL